MGNEADLSTTCKKGKEDPRLPEEDVHKGGKEGLEEEASEGQMAPDRCLGVRKTLKRGERIRRKKELERAIREGKRIRAGCFLVFMVPNDCGWPRVAALAARRLGKAYKRNRARRLIREFFRLNKCRLAPSFDYVIVAQKGAGELRLKEVEEQLGVLFVRRGDAASG